MAFANGRRGSFAGVRTRPVRERGTPRKELKGFAKTALKAEESKRVSITLNARSFAYYSIARKGWYVENGDFEILIGASSRDIRLSDTVKIQLPPNTQNSQ